MNSCFCVGPAHHSQLQDAASATQRDPDSNRCPQPPSQHLPGLQMEPQREADGAQQTGEFPGGPFSVGRLTPRVLCREERGELVSSEKRD